MSIFDKTLFDSNDKITVAIDRLKLYEPPEGYILAFSGGKDSIIIKKLADMAKVKYRAIYSLTTIDPPELVQFIKTFKDVKIDHPNEPFLKRLIYKGFPTRQIRWCCQEYKERIGMKGGIVITGVRSEESYKRSSRKVFETCFRNNLKKFVNPIIDWTESEVWEFIHYYSLSYCKLYNEGWKRIGCLFCPYAYYKERIRQADLYPRYKTLFIKAFDKLIEEKKKAGSRAYDKWKNGKELFEWWITDKGSKKYDENQYDLFMDW